MGQNSKIIWTDATFNPVRGCSRVSEGCRFCYAETMSARNPAVLGVWGQNGTRVLASESMWREPLKWDRQAGKAGVRKRVFCASLSDWLEDWTGPVLDSRGNRMYVPPGPTPWESYGPDQTVPAGRTPLTYTHVRGRLLTLIAATPNLNWLLLSKRPEGFADRMREVIRETSGRGAEIASGWLAGNPPANVWAMTTVENQEYADIRIPQLLKIPARVHGLSVEPMLGPVDIGAWTEGRCSVCRSSYPLLGEGTCLCGDCNGPVRVPLDWLVCGGESGSHARMFDLAWARSLRDQCRIAGVPFLMKQVGDNPVESHSFPLADTDYYFSVKTPSHHGADPADWPDDLRVMEFPAVPTP